MVRASIGYILDASFSASGRISSDIQVSRTLSSVLYRELLRELSEEYRKLKRYIIIIENNYTRPKYSCGASTTTEKRYTDCNEKNAVNDIY